MNLSWIQNLIVLQFLREVVEKGYIDYIMGGHTHNAATAGNGQGKQVQGDIPREAEQQSLATLTEKERERERRKEKKLGGLELKPLLLIHTGYYHNTASDLHHCITTESRLRFTSLTHTAHITMGSLVCLRARVSRRVGLNPLGGELELGYGEISKFRS